MPEFTALTMVDLLAGALASAVSAGSRRPTAMGRRFKDDIEVGEVGSTHEFTGGRKGPGAEPPGTYHNR